MPAEADLRVAADRIEALLNDLSRLADPQAHARAQELVRLLMQLYGAGLDRILEVIASDSDDAAVQRLFDRLTDDSLVSSLLVLHGLHPVGVAARIERALDRVRPYLATHGGNVTLLGVDGDTVRLRLEGSCHSCPSSTVTMKDAVERAIEEAAPEITAIEVEGVAPAPEAAGAAGGDLLQIGNHSRAANPAGQVGPSPPANGDDGVESGGTLPEQGYRECPVPA